jgi:hypothetical protein
MAQELSKRIAARTHLDESVIFEGQMYRFYSVREPTERDIEIGFM